MKRLHSLNPLEVSLVKKGANKRKFIVFKSDETKKIEKELLELVKKADPKVMAKIEEILKEYQAPVVKADGKEMPNEDPNKAMHDVRADSALKAVGRILAPFHGKIHPEALKKVLTEAGHPMDAAHADGAEDDKQQDDETMPAKPESVSDEHHKAAMGYASKAYKEQIGKLGYQMYATEESEVGKSGKRQAPTDDDDDEEESVEKALIMKADGTPDFDKVAPEIRPLIEALWKEKTDMAEKVAKSEKALAEEKEIRITKEFNERAASYKHLGAKTEDVAKVLKALSPEDCKTLEAVLKAADEQIGKGDLFTELGSKLSGGDASGDEIEKAAEGYCAKSDEDKQLSKAQKVAKYLETPEGKAMYAKHQAQRGGI